MQQRLTFITLGVADLDRSKDFYSDVLGWKPFQDHGGIVMYKLNGMVLSPYPQHELMEDAEVKEDGVTIGVLRRLAATSPIPIGTYGRSRTTPSLRWIPPATCLA